MFKQLNPILSVKEILKEKAWTTSCQKPLRLFVKLISAC